MTAFDDLDAALGHQVMNEMISRFLLDNGVALVRNIIRAKREGDSALVRVSVDALHDAIMREAESHASRLEHFRDINHSLGNK